MDSKVNWWDRLTDWTTRVTGGRWAFGVNVGLTLLWLVAGPIYDWSDRWQLWANTVTTIVTYLMVFVIQHSQNRADAASQLKLDELIRAVQGARNELAGIDRRGEQVIEELRTQDSPGSTPRTD